MPHSLPCMAEASLSDLLGPLRTPGISRPSRHGQVRVVWLMVVLLLACHLFGCVWWFIGIETVEVPSMDDFWAPRLHLRNASFATKCALRKKAAILGSRTCATPSFATEYVPQPIV